MDRPLQDPRVAGVQSPRLPAKIDLHLDRFRGCFSDVYGHERISSVGRRNVIDWQHRLAEGLAPATVNNHVASLSGFTTWVSAQEPGLFATGNPSTGISALPLPPLEPRSLTGAQVKSLKNQCDRFKRHSQRKGRRWGIGGHPRLHGHSRPVRDRAIVFLLLSTGPSRLELVSLDLEQVQSAQPAQLRSARRARVVGVRGKGRTQRTVFLSVDDSAENMGEPIRPCKSEANAVSRPGRFRPLLPLNAAADGPGNRPERLTRPGG